jgi:hypothetical protein
VAGEVQEIAVRLSPGARVAGVVVQEAKGPAAGASVTGRGHGSLTASASTGRDGTFELGPFAAGAVTLTASAKDNGGPPSPTEVVVKPGERRTGVKLVLARRTGTIRGLVLDGGKQPLPGVTVEAGPERLGPRRRDGPDGARAVTGGDGVFLIEGLRAESYTLWADQPGYGGVERPGVAPGGEAITLQLKKEAVLAGKVVSADDAPVPASTVVVVPPTRGGETDGARFRRATGPGVAATFADQAGAFRIEGLAPGNYDLVATAPDGSAGRLAGVTVAEGDTKRGLRVQVEGPMTVVGRVADASTGQPLAGIQVSCRDRTAAPSTSTDGSGAFSLAGVPRLPFLAITFRSAARTHATLAVAVTGAQARTDLGVVKLSRLDPGDPHRGQIGASYAERNGAIVVSAVAADSVAAAAGLHEGDQVLSIGGKKMTTLIDVAQAVRIDPGQEIRLVVQPPGSSPHGVVLRRPM